MFARHWNTVMSTTYTRNTPAICDLFPTVIDKATNSYLQSLPSDAEIDSVVAKLSSWKTLDTDGLSGDFA